ncbi:MAG: hypothetical protein AAB441_05205 [Patescibacteria group bacterium]
MKHQEKKYRVDSFDLALNILNKNQAKKEKEVVNVHYYAQKIGNDVVKLVKYLDRNEIHILDEVDGKYILKQKIPMENTEAGLQWLKEKDYKAVDIVKMAYTDYEYKGSIVGLYTINDFLYSIILDYPEGEHDDKEKEFGLNPSDVISMPYNKYLKSIGKNNFMKLK